MILARPEMSSDGENKEVSRSSTVREKEREAVSVFAGRRLSPLAVRISPGPPPFSSPRT